VLLALAFLAPTWSGAAPNSRGQVAAATTTLDVAIKPLDPFVLGTTTTEPSGYSIDLWNEIAERNGWKTRWVWNETVGDLLDDVVANRADVGIAGISMTRAREETVDFSYPIYDSGLLIAVTDQPRSWVSTLRGSVSGGVVRLIGLLALLIFLAGHVVWLIDRRKSTEASPYRKGFGEAWWWAGKTLGSADFGEKEPQRPIGRLFALLWMFTGIIIIANFTAAVSSQLTVDRIEGRIKGVQDLPGKSVLTVAGTTADAWLTQQGIAHGTVDRIESAYPQLLDERVDAVVFDAPVLLRWTATASGGRARTVGSVFNPEPYGIALPEGSELREAINASLLELAGDGTTQRLRTKWFGQPR
jgi:polar amino acid transport system substrate-binding protein